MAITFQHKIILRPGSVFCFGTISSVADEEGTLHRIADPPRRKSPPTTSENIRVKQGKAQPPALRKKIAFSKPGAEGPLTRRTPLSTDSRLEGGVNRAKLKFSQIITTTSRVSVRNINESTREGAKQIASK
jgi:hypothetical protein